MSSTGVGGPYEPADVPTSKGGYPPCAPGPGDDMCIQLYEPGVSASTNLAMNERLGGDAMLMASADAAGSWNNTATANGAGAETGMGGPYEPVPDAATGYPPCDGSANADKCIQLYERGVGAASN